MKKYFLFLALGILAQVFIADPLFSKFGSNLFVESACISRGFPFIYLDGGAGGPGTHIMSIGAGFSVYTLLFDIFFWAVIASAIGTVLSWLLKKFGWLRLSYSLIVALLVLLILMLKQY